MKSKRTDQRTEADLSVLIRRNLLERRIWTARPLLVCVLSASNGHPRAAFYRLV